jgi:hypothetical protein
MDKLSKLGNLSDDQKERLGKLQDFAKRFDEGAPADNISGREAAVAYRAVTRQLSPQQVEEASAEVFAGMSDDDRKQVSQIIKQVGGEQFADLDDDPQHLAAANAQLKAQGNGGLLDSLLGGQGGGGAAGLLDSPVVKTVLAGVASVAMSKFMGSQGGGGGLGGLLGGILGGGGGSSQGGGGGLDDLLGGILGGGGGSQGGGGLDDVLGGLLGGQEGGDEKPPSKRNVL